MSRQSGQRGRRSTELAAKSVPCKSEENILGPHGGYRQLRSFQAAQLVYDLTVRFCDRHIDRRSRTHDQMVQAARSGVQNIAEGSQAAATSSKTELKLTQVARASLEELKLDYEDFLRPRKLPYWNRNHPLRQALLDARLEDADAVATWIRHTADTLSNNMQNPGEASSSTSTSPSSLYPELAANSILTLATVAGFLLDRQMAQLAESFEMNGGFTERLYRIRSSKRNNS